jgi:N-acetylglucosamine kinase-like BadF-type ATPase
MGDEGSGYDIGRKALTAIARQVDGRGPETTITKLVFEDLEITHPFDLITKIYDPSMDKAAIATFARYPLDQAYSDDAVSLEIVDSAAKDLADMVTTAGRRLGFTTTLPLAMTGGIMLHILIIRERILARLRATWDVVEPVIVIDPALAAARSLANVSEVSA